MQGDLAELGAFTVIALIPGYLRCVIMLPPLP